MNQNIKLLNGFYFLKWNLSIDEIEESLKKNRVDYKFKIMKINPEFELVYNEMETFLFFDEDKFYNAQQYKRFDINDQKNSDIFFQNILFDLKKEYGDPEKINEDASRNLKEYLWTGDFTIISLCYFYKSDEIQLHWSRK